MLDRQAEWNSAFFKVIYEAPPPFLCPRCHIPRRWCYVFWLLCGFPTGREAAGGRECRGVDV